MKKFKFIFYFSWVIFLVGSIYLPGFSKLQELRQKDKDLDTEMARVRQENLALVREAESLKTEPVYLEAVARDKLGIVKKGEIIFKIKPEGE